MRSPTFKGILRNTPVFSVGVTDIWHLLLSVGSRWVEGALSQSRRERGWIPSRDGGQERAAKRRQHAQTPLRLISHWAGLAALTAARDISQRNLLEISYICFC